MTEQQQTTQTAIEDTVNAAVDQVNETAQAAVAHGRQVTALWLGVSRTAIDAAAKTLTATSELISSVAQSMGKLSDRIDDASKRA
jgi:hypothetical protein